MKKLAVLTLIVSLCSLTSFAADDQTKESKAADRVQAAADVLNEIEGAPDSGIPQEILGSAECVAVVPSMLKGGFIVGAKYGRGLASCRTPKGWSAPAFFAVEGGSFGFQIGGQAVDLVMLIMNKDGMRHLLSSQFALGADASVAAGPVGRHAEGNTDWKMRGTGADLFAGARCVCRGEPERSGGQAGQEFDPRVLRTFCDLEGGSDRRSGCACCVESLSDDSCQVGAGRGEVAPAR